MICECCGKEQATCKDYRERYNVTGSYRVCTKCLWLNDRAFWRKYNRTQKEVLDGIRARESRAKRVHVDMGNETTEKGYN